MLSAPDDRFFMLQALKEADLAKLVREVPIGCVIVKNGKIIGRGHNRTETLKDPTAHAEIIAIGAACASVDNWRLEGCTIYVSLEPCPMCAGAILNSRLTKVVFGSRDRRLGALGSTFNILEENPINREIEVVKDVMAHECLSIIKEFFRTLREKDSGSAGKVQLPAD